MSMSTNGNEELNMTHAKQDYKTFESGKCFWCPGAPAPGISKNSKKYENLSKNSEKKYTGT